MTMMYDNWAATIFCITTMGISLFAAHMWRRAALAQSALRTELKECEARLLQAQKMSAIGQLVGGIAHEINNPLSVIVGFAQSLERRIPTGHEFHSPVASIAHEARRCAALMRELLAFSRTDKRTTEALDLSEVVRSTALLLEVRARSQDVKVLQDLASDLSLVANKTQLQQVIVNLGNNALDAMAGGGTLTLRTRFSGAGEAVVEVIDTGTGIAEDLRARIFEPFFTTKEVGKGTGLGLSLVQKIVRNHAGRISVTSRLGKGTTMSVALPALGAAAQAA
jgi:signal transduction histidine kinase